ncbi:MAG TPA: cellulase family glycosylhydrolase [Microlunatus sp.]
MHAAGPTDHLVLPRRRRRSRRWVVLLVGMLVAATTLTSVVITPRATAAPPPPLRIGTAFGNELMWASDAELDKALDSTRLVGADWIRVDLPWADIQPSSPQEFSWHRFDRIMAAAGARDLAVIATLAYTPAWARTPGCPHQSCRPRDFAEFAQFAKNAALRYAPAGLRHWEIWNEPNTQAFWYPTPNAADYARLLRLSASAIKEVDGSATVLLGGLSAVQSPASGADIPQVTFLADVSMYRGTHAVDGVAFHPYTFPFLPSHYDPGGWRTSWNTIHGYDPNAAGFSSLRHVLDTYGLGHQQIWLTEYGAPTCGPRTGSGGEPGATVDHVTEQRQAAIAGDAVRVASADPALGALVWYSERDRSWNPTTTENCYGLRRPDGSPKPAWWAFRDAVSAVRASRPAR